MKINHRYLKHRIIEYPISAEYIDLDGNLWSYRAYIQMNYKYDVMDVVLMAIEVENSHGEPIPFRSILTEGLKQALQDHAADLAVEKIESIDFETESSYEDEIEMARRLI